MNRRRFLEAAGIAPSRLAMRTLNQAFPGNAGSHDWRTFEIITQIEVLKPSGTTRVWVPTSLIIDTPYQRTLRRAFKCESGTTRMFESRQDSLGIVVAEFPAGVRPVLTVTNRVATKNRSTNMLVPAQNRASETKELNYWLRPTKMAPIDGIVRERALAITASRKTDLDKARAIYEWIVENTYRNPLTHGCGTGNIRYMLESNDLGGKCADLNALYVGLARAAGLPARDLYGIRVGKSAMGYRSLGPSSEKISKAQHCRAEVYLNKYGWVGVDPADVRKVMLEEPPGERRLDDPMVQTIRSKLFGSWEMNWIAYNFANDVTLPGSSGAGVNFLMYPQAETADGRINSLDPDSFRYEIVAHEIRS
jgi:transglutaminase-like putative cysteine protease